MDSEIRDNSHYREGDDHGDSQYEGAAYESGDYGQQGYGDGYDSGSPHRYEGEEGDEGYGEHDGEEYEQEGYDHDQNDGGRGNYGEEAAFTIGVRENQMRRAKRDILNNLNRTREDYNLERFFVDLNSDLIAHEYAEFLTRGEHNIEYFKSLQKEFNIFGEIDLVHTVSRFEEDLEITADVFYQEFIDLGHLLLEVESDRKLLLNPDYNHIGVGVAFTNEKIILVQCFSKKMLAIQKICDGEDGGIEVRGKMLATTHGLYAVRLQNIDNRKDIATIGPQFIEFDRHSKEFIAFIDCDETISSSNKIIELYVRIKPETIEYKKPSKEKINLKHVELVMRCPCMTFPDPRFLSEDEKDRMRLEQERQMRSRAEEEARMRKEQERQNRKEARRQERRRIEEMRMKGEDIESIASSTQRSERSFMSKGSFLQSKHMGETAKSIQEKEQKEEGEDENGESRVDENGDMRESMAEKSEDEDRLDFNKKQSILSPEPIRDQEITNEKIMQELRQAHAEALSQKEKLMAENEELQAKIFELKKKKEGANALERQAGTDVSGMNEHKYMNTLAHVHQIRIDLKQTQDRYNKMAAELQMKLDEKQKKCNEIKRAFIELKREVARKAAFSRTDKPIPDKMIEDWEVKEIAKNRELQALRLENLRLRNTLAKNQKILKKKEELAEGLHLIDFEQLKIENQTLNEKIEERNEDLHKLKKKNTTTVQILTHTKEKLQFETKANAKLQEEGLELENNLGDLREGLTEKKGIRDGLRLKNQELKQKTLIFNSKSLKKDYEVMEKKLKLNALYLNYLRDKHEYMKRAIEEYNKQKPENATATNPQLAYSLNGNQRQKYAMSK